ncbi:TrkH family potassium uptake protein [Porphyromonas circumdentaria]|uniref:Trk system potassium uptake protein TrkH n=1 Tax=Porphyromonas circumdentaria TaxID=29524 RepID=A0A1T4MG73_9PORP|nr:TrkH family potassium uptake protein [Porphyromonas circumdentaria]MBB6275767.1 trk system potassium uptake protein TrkH [Porphyromonas circumdentaria]MDO4721728.1 TrkH family potassium uptake protein [Porphyromonas circumdentaria]SJZ65932.1 trk system potassium uptake protein TrkH [Porphyromonas circumdentaria]
MALSHLQNIQKRPLINYPFVALVVGNMCLLEAFFLAVCSIVSLSFQENDTLPFVYTTLIMLACGAGLVVYGKQQRSKQGGNLREGMLAVTATWVVLSLIGMLPFIFGGYTKTVVDAFFETVSGYTTTGATIFSSVEQLPHAILLWRSLIQWQGGIGIVVFSLALLPIMGKGGGLLYNAETTGIKHERFLPRITQVAKRLFLVYITLTLSLAGLLVLGDMNFFEALCHSFTCVSTGGYSTRDAGILAYNSPYIEYVITFFMFVGSLNMSLLYFAFSGFPKKLFKDEEFKWFAIFVSVFILVTFVWIYSQGLYDNIEGNFRHAIFQVVSLISTTGYITADMNEWHPFFFCIGIMMMTVCGCAGSTTGGLKMSRFMVLIKNLNNEFKKRVHPNMVALVRINGHSLASDLVVQVMAFISLYTVVILIGIIALTLAENSFITAASATFTCISNVGPSFGKYSMTFAEATGFEKGILSMIMLAGRLEVFTVISLLHPVFWKR